MCMWQNDACPSPNSRLADALTRHDGPDCANFLLDLIFLLHIFPTSASNLQQMLIQLIVNSLCTESWEGEVWRSEEPTRKHLSSISHGSAHTKSDRCSRFCSRRVGIHRLWGRVGKPPQQRRRKGWFRGLLKTVVAAHEAEQIQRSR